jgi:hypothetical protein
MTPKEKAEELVNKYLMNTPIGFHIDDAKECALIAVDELILDAYNNYFYNYWQEVKKEIEKL